MNSPDPVPAYFNLRYIAWMIWSNMLTGIGTIQLIFATLSLATNMFTPRTIQIFVITSSVLSVVIAQVKRNRPPGPPPTKVPTSVSQPSEKTS